MIQKGSIMTEKSTAFNQGTKALKQQIAILEQKNQELEKRVQYQLVHQ